MFVWKDHYHWEFSPAGYTDADSGPAITGAKMFRGGKYLNVVRETAQNGADAKNPDLPSDTPVKMVYEFINVPRDCVPGVDRLADVIEKGFKYISSIPNSKRDEVESLKAASDKYLKNSDFIPILKISDFNTVGLKDDRFDKLLRMEGITNKGDLDSGGSFGYGKYAPFLLSTVNTILYATLTSDNTFLFQGRSLQATFIDGHTKMKGNSLFGYENKAEHTFNPISDCQDVPEVFRRNQYGTDLYVLCFERKNDWIEQMAICALENFFYAVYIGKVEFVFKDGNQEVIINKNNLAEMIEKYRIIYEKKYMEEPSFTPFTAPKYWKVLNDERTIYKPIKDFRGKGQIKLYILMGEEIEGRSVLEMRSLGMKIQEDTGFRLLPSFNGLLIATGKGRENENYKKNISKFLLKMESPAHNSWSLDDVEIDDIKKEARAVLNGMHNWIKDTVKEQLPPNDGTPVDAFGLKDILPDVLDPGAESIEEEAAISFVPKKVNPEIVISKPKTNRGSGIGGGHGPGPVPGPGPGPGPGPKPGPGPIPGPGPTPLSGNSKGKLVLAPLKSKSSPYLESSKRYKIIAISEVDANPLYFQLRISGDSDSFDSVITGAWKENKRLSINNGMIEVPAVKKNEKIVFEVSLSENEKCALEVNAYVKK